MLIIVINKKESSRYIQYEVRNDVQLENLSTMKTCPMKLTKNMSVTSNKFGTECMYMYCTCIQK